MGDTAESIRPVASSAVPTPIGGGNGGFLIWQPSVFMAISDQIESVGIRDCPVVIKGEAGTAKETLARQIHAHSRRAAQPFIPVNCRTLRGHLLDSQLFGQAGNEEGKRKPSLGAFRAAEGGTVFLDEIDSLVVEMQAKILNVVQNQLVQPVGAHDQEPVNVRIICSTDGDMRKTVHEGNFLPDLYFRLNVATLELPPLRKRPDDIAIMAKYFLDLHAQMYNEPAKELTDSAINALSRYNWPGNVRELASVMEHAFVMSKSKVIDVDNLPNEIVTSDVVPDEVPENDFPAIDDVDRKLVTRALEKTRGQKMAAAKLLKIDHRKLTRLISKFNLDMDHFKEG